MPERTKVILSNGTELVLDAPVDQVRLELSQDKRNIGEAFPEFSSAGRGKKVYIAGDHVAYFESE